MKIRQKAFDNGLICYPVGGNVDGVNGDVIIIAPPYNVTAMELDEIAEKTADSVRQVLKAEGLA
jgi:adenosylmethionine-8-amino-7-oxononanoate aminotransferase